MSKISEPAMHVASKDNTHSQKAVVIWKRIPEEEAEARTRVILEIIVGALRRRRERRCDEKSMEEV